jgi:hypothetical protein
MCGLEFQDPHLGIDGEECLLELVNTGRRLSEELVQLVGKGRFLTRQEFPRPQGRNLATEVSVHGVDLIEDQRGLRVEPEHFDFSVNPLSNGEDAFIDRLTRDRKFSSKAYKEIKEHRGSKGERPIREIM